MLSLACIGGAGGRAAETSLRRIGVYGGSYLEMHDDGLMDSLAMSPGEHAIAALAEYGYMQEIDLGRTFGRWSDAGRALLDLNYPYHEQSLKPFPEPPLP